MLGSSKLSPGNAQYPHSKAATACPFETTALHSSYSGLRQHSGLLMISWMLGSVLIMSTTTTTTIKPHATALVLHTTCNWLKLSLWKHSACAHNNLRICKRPRLRELGHGSCTCTDAGRLCGLRLLAARSSVGTCDCWLRMASMSPASADRCLRRVPAATAAPTAATPRAPLTLSHTKQHLYSMFSAFTPDDTNSGRTPCTARFQCPTKEDSHQPLHLHSYAPRSCKRRCWGRARRGLHKAALASATTATVVPGR